MNPQLSTPNLSTRIVQLHEWYCRNVLPMRLTPEVERLWLEWLKAGYCGPDLRDVVRYIRKQIALGKRNEGALKLTNLIARGEVGFIGFDQDLGLARARTNLNPMKKLEPAPEQVTGDKLGSPAPQPATCNLNPSTPAAHKPNEEALRKLREAAN